MKPGAFSAGLIGLLAMLAGPARLPIGEQPIMIGKAIAEEGGKKNAEEGTPESKTGPAPVMPMARDPSAAVMEEFEAARRAGTREAFELFIARHGDDPLAERARAELKRRSR
ncbi:hypothetical protein MA20_43265 [Bradyrhizobium japonicum]|uniref:Uncharacterized protein n=1 Tax=Bradyrhizobium japonicum TaxID=375 RepID=A0A0A3XGT6_BRAJP|nr:hypothetical protein [Bradyrhizobium japonicum]KGT73632.1 hypothetical protein MA20_43265 [Bradyrhizobium japonicum]